MNSNVEALQGLYVKMGGNLEDVSDKTTISEMIDAITKIGIVDRVARSGNYITATTAAEMNDESAIYVYTGSESGYNQGHLYYWDGTEYVDGGEYNGAKAEIDPTLSHTGKAADAKETGDKIRELNGSLGTLGEDLMQVEESVFDEASETGTAITIHGGISRSTLTAQSGTTSVRHTGKNVLPFPYFFTKQTTINGITYTPNSDGTIHVQGTATDRSQYYIVNQNAAYRKEVKPGTYVLSGCPAGGSGNTYEMIMNGTGGNVIDQGDGVQFTVAENKMIYLRFIVHAEQTVDITLHPMIEYGNVKTEYEPYKGEIIQVSASPVTVSLYGNTDIFAADTQFTVKYFIPAIKPTGIISIKDYGALGDGVTDDTTAIINALTAGAGNTVFIPKGTYLFSRTLHVKSGTKFIGAGAESILQVANSYSLDSYDWRPTDEDELVHIRHAFIVIDRTENGVTLEDFKLRGQTYAFVDACLDGISVQGKNNVVRNVVCNDINYFYDAFLHRVYSGVGRAINVIFAENCIIENCTAERNGYEGIGVEESTNITVRNCFVGNSCQTGIQIHRVCKNIKIFGNLVKYDSDKTNLSCTIHAKQGFDTDNIVIQSNCFETGMTVMQGGENGVSVLDNYFVRGGMTNNAEVYRQKWFIRGNRFGSGGITMRIDNCIITDNMLTVNAGYLMINMRGNNVIAANNIPLGSVSGIYIEQHDTE